MTKITFVVAEITFKVVVLILVVAQITFCSGLDNFIKVAVFPSLVAKITFTVD